jgi:cell division protein FtsW
MILLLLAAISILSVYSSTYRITMRTENLTDAILRHVVFLVTGFVITYIMHKVTYKYYKMLSPLALFVIVVCLILVFILPGEREKRWLFSRSFQPSDVAKVVMVVYLAKVLSDGFGRSVKEFILRAIVPIFIVCALIIRGHTSNAMIIGGVSVLMIFMGASRKKYQAVNILFVISVISVYLLFVKDIGRGETAVSRTETWSTWITNVFWPSSKTDNGATAQKPENYLQATTAQYAIVSGGLFRIAPGKSFYRKTLADAHNDFIFAVIVEEYGMAGGIFLIIMYLILFYRILLVMRKCTKSFTSLMLSGLLIVIISQTFIHIGVSVGGLPVTGQNLPMISTGGTSILITCAAFGMILAVSRTVEQNNSEKSTNNKKTR